MVPSHALLLLALLCLSAAVHGARFGAGDFEAIKALKAKTKGAEKNAEDTGKEEEKYEVPKQEEPKEKEPTQHPEEIVDEKPFPKSRAMGDNPGSKKDGVIEYEGGEVLSTPIKLFLLFYGSVPEFYKTAIRSFINSISDPRLGSTPASVKLWWNVARLYADKKGHHVTAAVSLEGESSLPASQGMSLTRDDINSLILTQIEGGQMPKLDDAVYAFVTAEDVKVEAFEGHHCSWHHNGAVLFLWAGASPAKTCGKVLKDGLKYPHGDQYLDALIAGLARQLVQTATDPYKMSWIGNDGEGSVDACHRRKWGNEYTSDSNEAYTSVGVGGSLFLLPTIMNPVTKRCMNALSVLPQDCGKESSYFFPCDGEAADVGMPDVHPGTSEEAGEDGIIHAGEGEEETGEDVFKSTGEPLSQSAKPSEEKGESGKEKEKENTAGWTAPEKVPKEEEKGEDKESKSEEKKEKKETKGEEGGPKVVTMGARDVTITAYVGESKNGGWVLDNEGR